ncbi:hypothetical protein TWF679_011402 [Orbilia oligospora]|uniref:ATP-dependent DNA ligase family profile domain-containing protein n=1 Tax=Orbilia oligospora TaxID=2813651 RepID=A0A8H8UY04_ORBOL|nr:hypothetical protein TWF679_011402 [Orbilia oligospora]
MPFLFSHVCDLLSTLESLYNPSNPTNANELPFQYKTHINSWLTYFRSDLPPELWLPLFSLLWPEGRPDRVYGFKEDGLITAISAAMCFGRGRIEELKEWRVGGRGGIRHRDLGECVERVFAMSENVILPSNAVTITEIEEVLNELASHCRFSSSDIRGSDNSRGKLLLTTNKNGTPIRQFLLGRIYMRLSSRDAKWFTRIILKSLLPVTLEPDNLFREFHFLLPEIWRIRGQLESALSVLGSKTFRLFPCAPSPDDEEELREAAERLLLPEMGVKVGRPVFMKALSCERVIRMAGRKTWALERKYDGEYCQIHIDLTRDKDDWLKIYSKSGRDSTQDRISCHEIIRKCLHLDDSTKRKIKQRCILEAEFLVYSDTEDKIASFHSIRNHVMRSGTYVGTSLSVVHKHQSTEHIMLKFFDCILLDDICTPANTYSARRYHLESLIHRIENKAELVTRKLIDFSRPDARDTFFETFAEGIGLKWEGFVMKPVEGRYVGWGVGTGNYWVKLKRDYIPGFGDSADFVVVGGRCGGKRGVERGLNPADANTFYAACLTNKQEVVTSAAKPIFKVVFTVSYNLTQADLTFLRSHRYFHGVGYSKNPDTTYEVLPLESHFPEPDFLFNSPLVLECFGAGFDKAAFSDYWTLCWPRVQKIHQERGFTEAVTFEELQVMGEKASTVSDDCMDEIKEWEEKLKASAERRRRLRPFGTEQPRGMLAKPVWEADSQTTKKLAAVRQWTPVVDSQPSFRASQVTTQTESQPSQKRKRPLSQISENGQSMGKEFEDPEATQTQDSQELAVLTSPLFQSRVYLIECLSDRSDVKELLKTLEVNYCGSCIDLAASGETKMLSRAKEKAILLVDEAQRDDITKFLTRLGKTRPRRKLMVEVYSWRILEKMKEILEAKNCGESEQDWLKKRRVAVDWSVMHLDTISSAF